MRDSYVSLCTSVGYTTVTTTSWLIFTTTTTVVSAPAVATVAVIGGTGAATGFVAKKCWDFLHRKEK